MCVWIEFVIAEQNMTKTVLLPYNAAAATTIIIIRHIIIIIIIITVSSSFIYYLLIFIHVRIVLYALIHNPVITRNGLWSKVGVGIDPRD